MIIKKSKNTHTKLFLKRSKKIGSIAALLIGVFFTSALSYLISNEKQQVRSLANEITGFWNLPKNFRPPYKSGDFNTFGTGFYKGKPDFPGAKRISLDIKHKHWESLKIYRNQSLKAGHFIKYKDLYVPAKIRFKNKIYKARIRIKGMSIDHIKQDKWSYRVILKGQNTLFGMKQFSLQHPVQRHWLYEKIIHLAMKREGLLGLRYDFIYLSINGKDMGIYAIEEHFEKRLVENNRRINGPIVKISNGIYTSYDTAKSATVKKKPFLFRQSKKAKASIRALLAGELEVEQVFDTKKLAKFAALIDLFAASHGAHWSSSRMYYNPVTSRLEIFSYDNTTLGYFDNLIGAGRNYFQKKRALGGYPLFSRFFNDTEFFKEYVKALEQVTKKSYLDKMLAELKNTITRDEKFIQSEWINFGFSKQWFFDYKREHPSSIEMLYQNQKEIRAILSGKGMIKANYQNYQGNKTTLAVTNNSPMPIELLGIYFQNTLYPPITKTILPVKKINDQASTRLINFPDLNIGKQQNSPIKLKYKIMGASLIQEAKISHDTLKNELPFKTGSEVSLDRKYTVPLCPKVRKINELKKYDFLDFKIKTQKIFIKTGTWELSKTFVLPAGYKVIIQPKTKIIFKNCSSILTYSPVTYLGEQFPFDIYFIPTDITRQKSNLAEYKFLDINQAEKRILIRKGSWELFNNLIIPKGYKLIARPGTKLNLKNRSTLLSYSPIDFIGTKEEPIVIQSSNNNGGGLVVLNAETKSNLKHTIFSGLSSPDSQGWKLTGSVTFYESDIKIENCHFIGNNSEDALHILRSTVQIYKSHFKDSLSDAFDGDFIKGEIIQSTFQNSGNDAIDISGSRLKIKNVQIDHAEDKGISAGENSRVSIEKLEVKQAKIAIASKDMSNVLVKNISIEGSKVGFAAYQKKSEFGPAKINVSNVRYNETGDKFVLESGSKFFVDGLAKSAKQNQVYSLLYPQIN